MSDDYNTVLRESEKTGRLQSLLVAAVLLALIVGAVLALRDCTAANERLEIACIEAGGVLMNGRCVYSRGEQ